MTITNTILTLKPGLHILRYPKGETATFVIARAPGGNGQMQTLSTPATRGNLLQNGADCIVILVSDAEIDLMINAILPEGQTETPRLRVDQVGLDEVPVPSLSNFPIAPSAQIVFEVSPSGLSLIGHIETKGDVLAQASAILGDADAKLRVEGFQIVWPDKPSDVELSYSAGIEGLGLLPTVAVGTFCGTRGEARRINEVVFSLNGEGASGLELHGTAYFSGGFKMPIANNMRISGPSGFEHLVALQVNVSAATPAATINANPWENAQKTSIFKSESHNSKNLTKKHAAPAKKTPIKK